MTALRILQLLVVLNAVGLIIQSVRIIAVYSSIHAVTEGPRGQLPLHVWTIATSYLIFVCGTSYLLVVDPSFHGITRVVLYGAAGVMGQYALWNLLSYERRRLTAATNFGTDDHH